MLDAQRPRQPRARRRARRRDRTRHPRRAARRTACAPTSCPRSTAASRWPKPCSRCGSLQRTARAAGARRAGARGPARALARERAPSSTWCRPTAPCAATDEQFADDSQSAARGGRIDIVDLHLLVHRRAAGRRVSARTRAAARRAAASPPSVPSRPRRSRDSGCRRRWSPTSTPPRDWCDALIAMLRAGAPAPRLDGATRGA